MIRVSVVVPTYRRPGLLERCLTALSAQRLAPDAYEILVVDDAGCAATKELVARWSAASRTPLRYLATNGARGPAAARNLGWRAARGAIVAFTDDDCVPAPDWLPAGLAAFVDGVAGVAGSLRVPLAAVPTDYEANAAALEASQFATANCFYRRDALAAVGGFDERFTAPWREDSDLYFTLLEAGRRLERAPAAVVVHPVRPAGWGVSLAQQRKSEFNALLYKKHPRLYRERVQASPPWRYYAATGALALAGASAIARRRWPLLAAAAVWGGLTAQFCARRLERTSHAPAHVLEMAVTSALIPPLAVYWRLRGACRFRVPFL